MPVGIHPNRPLHAEPLHVSPLIRGARWALLGLGIGYGWFRYYQICEKHADIRAWEHEQDTELTLESKRIY